MCHGVVKVQVSVEWAHVSLVHFCVTELTDAYVCFLVCMDNVINTMVLLYTVRLHVYTFVCLHLF